MKGHLRGDAMQKLISFVLNALTQVYGSGYNAEFNMPHAPSPSSSLCTISGADARAGGNGRLKNDIAAALNAFTRDLHRVSQT